MKLPGDLTRFLQVFAIFLALASCVPPVMSQTGNTTLEDIDDLLIDIDDVDDDQDALDNVGTGQVETQQAVPGQVSTPASEAAASNPQPAAAAVDDFLPVQPAAGNGDSVAKDVILVLDNSGSMRQNDPSFLTSRAVTEFIRSLDAATRLAIIIFDQDVSLAVPLTEVSIGNRGNILDSLDRINYRGLFTDSPAAIERAIYELKNNGREGVQKLIIFMTDGIVDTGNPQQDVDKSQWLRESLAPDAAGAGIKIFGIAFTEDADFRLIQSLAQETGGEYFRTLRPEDIGRVFERVNSIINTPPEPEVDRQTPASTPALPAPQAPVIIEVPAQPVQTLDREERIRSIIVISGVAVMIVAVLVILFLLIRRGREMKSEGQEVISEAYLNDINGFTASASYKLGKKPTMLGRVAGMDKDHLDYIVIPESTIGRRHSLIEYKDYAYWIVDQGSINGTFVNDKPITSETRLKHGDKVRLHKYEFEFVMPEMVDAGMTVVSNTMLASHSQPEPDSTELRKSVTDTGREVDFDLGFGEGGPAEDEADDDADLSGGDETLMPGAAVPDPDRPAAGPAAAADDDDMVEDETLMPASESATPKGGTPIKGNPVKDDDDEDDATLMPGDFNLPEEDATIRREPTDSDDSFENLYGDQPRDKHR